MNLRQIEVFHAVYSTGSVSRAAELLNVSQPSVSKVLRHTEDILGFQLFERVAGRLIPTKEAQDLSKSASRVQAEVERLNNRVHQLTEARTGSLRLAMTPGIGLSAGPEALAQFNRTYPDIVPEIETLHFEDAVGALLDGRADLAIVYQPFPHPGIKEIHLVESEFVCVSSRKNRFDRKKIHLSALNGENVITLHSQAPLGRILSNQLKQHAPDLVEVTTANTYHIAKSLAAQGVGHAIVDSITALSPPRDGTVVSRFHAPVTFSVTAIFQESRLLSAVDRKFLECIKAALERLLRSASSK